MTEIQELREIVQAQAQRVTVLTHLVERMGRQMWGSATGQDYDENTGEIMAWGEGYPLTIIGQREYDAAMHEAEGAPPDAGMLESVQ